MQNLDLLLGIALMVLGVSLVFAAVFRTLGHAWSMGAYELWALLLGGALILLLGRWLIQ